MTLLKNKIRKIREVLRIFRLELLIENGKYYVSGKEANIRRLSEEFFWEFFKGSVWPFENINEKSIEERSRWVLKPISKKIPLLEKRKVQYALAIQEIRFRKGHFFKIDEPFSIYTAFLEQFIDSINLSMQFFPSEDELYYFYFWLSTKSKYYAYFDIEFNKHLLKNKNMTELASLNFEIVDYVNQNIEQMDEYNEKVFLDYLICTHMNIILYGSVYSLSNTELNND